MSGGKQFFYLAMIAVNIATASLCDIGAAFAVIGASCFAYLLGTERR